MSDDAQLFPGLYPEKEATNSIDDRPAKPITTVRIQCVGGPLGAPSSKKKANWLTAGNYLRFSAAPGKTDPEIPDTVDFPGGVYTLERDQYRWTSRPAVK